MTSMRKMIFEKYDNVSAHILEYIEEQTKFTKDELHK